MTLSITKLKENVGNILLIILILLVGILTSCSVSNKSLTLTDYTSNRTKTFDYKGNLYLRNDTLWFETVKGTNQCVDLARYGYEIHGKDRPIDVDLLRKRNF
jgi:hypothetical protein